MKRRIAIVGAGPSGSSLAVHLVRAGIDPKDLVIVDRARFPRPKLCGGGITFRGTGLVRDLLGHDPGFAQSTVGLEFRSCLGRYPVRELGRQWVVDRGELDDALLDVAKEAGVEVLEGTAVTGLSTAGDRRRIETRSGPIDCDFVVGADGATSLVRREAGLPGGTVGRLVEAVYEPVSADERDDVLVFDFDPIVDGIPGYAWIFPYPSHDGRRLFKLGVMDGRGVVPGERLRAYTESFAAAHGFRRVDDKLAGWPEHYFAFRAKSSAPGLLLTGEAFGIDPLLGEGITPALEISAYAARRLAAAVRAGRRTIPFYEAGFVASRDGRNLLYQALLADRLYGRHPNRWMRVLFENARLRTIAGSGRVAYGRLSGTSASLGLAFFLDFVRAGFPSNAPVERAISPGTRPGA